MHAAQGDREERERWGLRVGESWRVKRETPRGMGVGRDARARDEERAAPAGEKGERREMVRVLACVRERRSDGMDTDTRRKTETQSRETAPRVFLREKGEGERGLPGGAEAE